MTNNILVTVAMIALLYVGNGRAGEHNRHNRHRPEPIAIPVKVAATLALSPVRTSSSSGNDVQPASEKKAPIVGENNSSSPRTIHHSNTFHCLAFLPKAPWVPVPNVFQVPGDEGQGQHVTPAEPIIPNHLAHHMVVPLHDSQNGAVVVQPEDN